VTRAEGRRLFRWLRLVEDHVVLMMAAYLGQFLVVLRHLVVFLLGAPALLFLVVSSYPYQPQRTLLLLVLGLFLAVLIRVGSVLVQVEHDPVLSRSSNTTPNRITFDRDFFTTVLPYLLPLVGILLALLGELTGVVTSWLDPLLKTGP
jgi:hypothetical protein